MTASDPIPVFDLGTAPYARTQDLQRRLRRSVGEGHIPGVLLLLEHGPVVTLGKRGRSTDLLRELPPHVDLVQSERGGAATIHMPGQLVSYPIVPLPGRNVRAFVRSLEEILLEVLQSYGLEAHRREGYPGLYVGEDKIASIGLRCERWVSSHGTSLNVAPDLDLFELIVSCGEQGLRQTSMAELMEEAPPLSEVKERYREAFARALPFPLQSVRRLTVSQVEEALGLRPAAART